ncbi:hypothetical protein JMJ77_0013232 [Colletotrichum scovillei]|uniref:Uncharacterized protein n=1 Tax=Colletotrichum scovillei TaxID=1209932 RepID=A0A9P7R5A9_9PEZI|nr:hypothetical protein JMJ77_0013232 [Colletotrichum scovillei]KAG7069526.1 hypothetical protein JMJ76_0003194 [Colletotrichum scovillei]KAG7073475.1 hypothetical protein JMJ78_0014449 [Colletotrichum scovillei]
MRMDILQSVVVTAFYHATVVFVMWYCTESRPASRISMEGNRCKEGLEGRVSIASIASRCRAVLAGTEYLTSLHLVKLVLLSVRYLMRTNTVTRE